MVADDLPSGQLLALGIVVVTAIVAPTWLAWWNSHVAKNEMRTNGGKSFRDDFNKLVATVEKQGKIQEAHTKTLDRQNSQLGNLVKHQKEIQEKVTAVEKDNLLVGFALGVKSKDQITGEIPVTTEEIVDANT